MNGPEEIGSRRDGVPTQPAPTDHLAAIVESSRDAIISQTLDGTILSWNRGAELIYGYGTEEAVGRPVSMLVPAGHHGALPGYIERLRSGEAPAQYETDTVHIRKDGRLVDVALTVSLIREGGGAVSAVSIIARDISERKQVECRLTELANTDDLTGFVNRRFFHEELQRHLDHCSRYGSSGALLLLDLDKIKNVNDSLGHGAGDQMIKQSAARLNRRLRGGDVIGRLGGDEFGVLLPEADPQAVDALGTALLTALREGGVVTTSIGAAVIDGPLNVEELMIRADVALYSVKDRGGDGIALYHERMDARFEE